MIEYNTHSYVATKYIAKYVISYMIAVTRSYRYSAILVKPLLYHFLVEI